MARERKTPAVPGDVRMAALTDRGYEQPLDEAQKRLKQRGYELFRFFYDQHREFHQEIREARLQRKLRQEKKSTTSPAGNTLNSSIDNVIADQIDNMPEAIMVAERQETMDSAEEMTDVVGYVMYQADWDDKFQTILEDAVVTGTGIAEVFWDEDAENGEGMVNVLAWHPEDMYPDPMYENIQDGRAVFKTTHTTVAWVEEHYPHAKGYVREDEYARQDDRALVEVPAGDQKVTLIEYWYKRYDAEKRKYRVHMAQLAGGALLFSSELDFHVGKKGEYREGLYAHGQYPFTFYRYRKVPKQPFGTGLIHDYKETQETIDRYYKYIDDNARQSSVQRTFVRKNSGVNADQIADLSQTVIEWEGNDIREVMQTIQASPLNNQVFQMTQYLSDMMKLDSGQNQFSRGEGGLGVTAASAIEALQEAGGKISRWHTAIFKSAFKSMTEQILWVLSEYLDPKRKFLIVGGWDSTGNMKDRLIQIKAPKAEGDALPKPAYTVRVQVQKSNPLQLQSFNELLMKAAEVCAQSGQPLPPDVFISLIQGYPNKQGVLKAIRENSSMQEQMRQMAAQIEQLQNDNQKYQKNIRGLEESLMTQGGGALTVENQKDTPNDSGTTQPAMGGEIA